jgi:hypothetical protein
MLQAGLNDFVNQLRFHGQLEADLNVEPDMFYFGQSVVVSAGCSFLFTALGWFINVFNFQRN